MCRGLFVPTQFHFECCGFRDDSWWHVSLHLKKWRDESQNMNTLWKVINICTCAYTYAHTHTKHTTTTKQHHDHNDTHHTTQHTTSHGDKERQRETGKEETGAPHSLCQILWCVDSSLSRCQWCQSAGTVMSAAALLLRAKLGVVVGWWSGLGLVGGRAGAVRGLAPLYRHLLFLQNVLWSLWR